MSADYCIDANIFITAWNVSHPMDVFPGLWRKLAVHRTDMVLIKPIYDQIDPLSPADKNKTAHEKRDKYPLRTWMIDNHFTIAPIDESVERFSLSLERTYEVRDRSGGVDENDIKLIAYAKVNDKIVVTTEEKQPNEPKKKYNYKIPLVCDEQDVQCIDFVEMLRRLNIQI